MAPHTETSEITQTQLASESESELFIRTYFRPRRPRLRPCLVAVAEATWKNKKLYVEIIVMIKSGNVIVRRQKPIFGVKCAISGNNHFFAFFIRSCCVDEIWPGWELAIGLAFSESKMAANLQHSLYLDVSFVLETVE